MALTDKLFMRVLRHGGISREATQALLERLPASGGSAAVNSWLTSWLAAPLDLYATSAQPTTLALGTPADQQGTDLTLSVDGTEITVNTDGLYVVTVVPEVNLAFDTFPKAFLAVQFDVQAPVGGGGTGLTADTSFRPVLNWYTDSDNGPLTGATGAPISTPPVFLTAGDVISIVVTPTNVNIDSGGSATLTTNTNVSVAQIAPVPNL